MDNLRILRMDARKFVRDLSRREMARIRRAQWMTNLSIFSLGTIWGLTMATILITVFDYREFAKFVARIFNV